jgi:nitrite reductase/ring-hydroxylating ferredoxin subunit/uncharacterized membrane protein
MPARDLPTIEIIDDTIENSTLLKKGGTEVKVSLHKAILGAGPLGRSLADLLHGKWLGHPLHPVLTDITLGAWVSGVVLDLASLATGRRRLSEAADTLVELGTVSALSTGLAGMADYSAIKQDAVEYGAAHALLNGSALALFVASIRARRQRKRDTGVALSLAGLGVSMLSAWLGGEMVYRLRVGTDHAKRASQDEDWTPVLSAILLAEGEARRVELHDEPVLLYRHNGAILAVGAVCPHAGGPLDEGQFDGACVTCPWHDSVFDLRDGSVVHGPSTYNLPAYAVRVVNGQIELRAAE